MKVDAVGGTHAQADRPAVANDFERNLDPGGAAAPDLAIEIAQTFDLRSADAGENIAATDSRFGRRAPFRNARDDDLIAILGRKNPSQGREAVARP